MGMIYFIGCNDCKVKRDLDKFYTISLGQDVDTRQKALEYAEKDIVKDNFRFALLASFLQKHKAHDCRFFDEDDDGFCELMKDEDIDFWKSDDI